MLDDVLPGLGGGVGGVGEGTLGQCTLVSPFSSVSANTEREKKRIE